MLASGYCCSLPVDTKQCWNDGDGPACQTHLAGIYKQVLTIQSTRDSPVGNYPILVFLVAREAAGTVVTATPAFR